MIAYGWLYGGCHNLTCFGIASDGTYHYYDSVTGEALPGCTFQLRFLGGTSDTGGTVIGQKTTGQNGTCIWTGLTAGTYIIEEIDPTDSYSIINSSETVYISDDGVQNVVTVKFDNAPDGSLLIRKVCSVNPSVTLQDAEFTQTSLRRRTPTPRPICTSNG